jgi:hypothetical protein
MRIIVPILIVAGVVYFWDAKYNNGVFVDGTKRLVQDIRHNMR